MVLILALFGVLLAITGLTVFARRQKAIGAALFLVGGAFIVLGVVALLNFHP